MDAEPKSCFFWWVLKGLSFGELGEGFEERGDCEECDWDEGRRGEGVCGGGVLEEGFEERS